MNQSLTLPVIGSPAKSNLDIVKRLTSARIIYLIGGHIVLAILMKKFGAIATIHAYFVFVFGIKMTVDHTTAAACVGYLARLMYT